MRRHKWGYLCALAIATVFCWPSGAEEDQRAVAQVQALGRAVRSVAEHALPSVVQVSVQYEESPTELDVPEFMKGALEQCKEAGQMMDRLGSGLIVDEDGHVLTVSSLVEGATRIRVTLQDGRRLKASLKATDPRTELALLKVNGTRLRPARLDASESVDVGLPVLVIGSPYGLEGSVNFGIIASLRQMTEFRAFDRVIQIDAAVGPGHAGAAVVDFRGHVVGLVAGRKSSVPEGASLGFALPVDAIKKALSDLKAGRTIKRAFLGLTGRDLTSREAAEMDRSLGRPVPSPGSEEWVARYARPGGAKVMKVTTDSPASRAGLQEGDLVATWDGEEVGNMHHLVRLVTWSQPGTHVRLGIVRAGERKTLSVTLGPLPQSTR